MTTAASAQVRAYVASKPPEARRRLRDIRAAVRSAVPEAVEHFSYGIPGFRLEGQALAWYAAWKTHMSMYPLTAGTRRANAAAIAKFKTAKGTIQFPMTKPLPIALIRKIVKARAAEIRAKSLKG